MLLDVSSAARLSESCRPSGFQWATAAGSQEDRRTNKKSPNRAETFSCLGNRTIMAGCEVRGRKDTKCMGNTCSKRLLAQTQAIEAYAYSITSSQLSSHLQNHGSMVAHREQDHAPRKISEICPICRGSALTALARRASFAANFDTSEYIVGRWKAEMILSACYFCGSLQYIETWILRSLWRSIQVLQAENDC